MSQRRKRSRQMWIVARSYWAWIPLRGERYKHVRGFWSWTFEVCAVFYERSRARRECKNEHWWIGPMRVGAHLPRTRDDWKGIETPNLKRAAPYVFVSEGGRL